MNDVKKESKMKGHKKLYGQVGNGVKKIGLFICVVTLCITFLVGSSVEIWAKKVRLTFIAERYPAMEYYGKAMSEKAPADVQVESLLMPIDKVWDKAVTEFASGAPTFDIVFGNPPAMKKYAAAGWLEPLDEYIEKYKEEFNFDDIPEAVWEGVKYEGKIYSIPVVVNVLLYFYRKDLYAKSGIAAPPQTLEEYLEIAEKLNDTDKKIYGTGIPLKPTDPLSNAFHSFLSATGGSWVDDNLNPTINEPEGVMALIYLKRMLEFAPPDVVVYGNDEGMVAMQHSILATMIHWATRCAAMDDPSASEVVNQVEFAVSPSLWRGGTPASLVPIDSFAIPKFTANDKDLIFRTIARGTDYDSMVEGAKYHFPARSSIARDPEFVKKNRFWPAVSESLEQGAKSHPADPDWLDYSVPVCRRISQFLEGKLGAKEALDFAADDIRNIREK